MSTVMIDPLAAEMRDILLRLWMLPWGKTSNYNPDGGGGVPDSRPPSGVRFDGPSERLPHEYWSRQWDRAVGTYQKEKVRDGAREELERWQHAPERFGDEEEGTEEREARMIREGRGWSPKDVSLHFNCTPKYVERVRRNAGVATDTGEGMPVREDSPQEEEVKALIARGLSERQVRMFTGCGGSTIARLKAAA